MSANIERTVSKQNDKELIQCLCLAYFAHLPNSNAKNHEETFYALLAPEQEEKSLLNYLIRNYLSENFPVRNLILFLEQESKKVTKATTAEQSKVNVRNKLRRIYLITKALIQKRYFTPKNYFYLDSTSEFFNFIKVHCIQKIKRALNFSGSIRLDIFSSIDIIILRKTKLDEIYKKFDEQFKSKESIIKNGLIAGELYAKLFQKYIDDKSWFPISLKLPETISGAEKSTLKLVSSKPSRKNTIEIDPYIRLLSLLSKNPITATNIIDDFIDINFDKFDIINNQNWTFPVDFNYSKIKDPDLEQSLLNHNLSFDLLILEGGSWNGSWGSKSLSNQAKAGHFGGLKISSFETIIKQHKDFNFIFNKVLNIRKEIFNIIIKKYEPQILIKNRNYYNLKSLCSKDLGEKTFITHRHNKFKNIKNFFNLIENSLNLQPETIENEYQLGVINKIRGLLGNEFVSRNQQKHLQNHFEASQMSYFLFNGGKTLQLLFKKMFILMLYGWITKKSLSIVRINNFNFYEMKNVIEGIIEDQQRKLSPNKVTFSVAPHYILT